MDLEATKIIIFSSAFVLGISMTVFVILFLLFQKKKVQMLFEQKEKEKEFEDMLKNAEVEIKETALKNIAWELHDNVGQLLSMAKLELNIFKSKLGDDTGKVDEIADIISNSLSEIRSISKVLNSEYINSVGLETSLKIEVDRLNRLRFIETYLHINGDIIDINSNDEIILFRMIQEFLTNTVKHAQASKLDIILNYLPHQLEIAIKDNGKGFDINTVTKNSGLINMQSRAKMIQTQYILQSDQSGTQLQLIYPITHI